MNYALTLEHISRIHHTTQSAAARAINHLLTVRNWLIGAHLIEYEQNGEDRATYGERLLKTMAVDLRRRGLRGMSETNLKYGRTFALAYPAPAIRQTVSDEFGKLLPDATAGMDEQLFVSRYLVALPSEERLQQWLIEEREQLRAAHSYAPLSDVIPQKHGDV
jgi:hypothetical protein